LTNEELTEEYEDDEGDTEEFWTAEAQQLGKRLIAAIVQMESARYGTGAELETAVIQALASMGFTAARFEDDESEFDVVFSDGEQRCIGEVEGKENKAINIDKISQLERNLQEDFAKEGVTEFAKGVMFGNAFRLREPNDRGDYFTAKALQAAQRAGIALVRTTDLYLVALSLEQGKQRADYAGKCRSAILEAGGGLVTFPRPIAKRVSTKAPKSKP
jgi:hypothetical protein